MDEQIRRKSPPSSGYCGITQSIPLHNEVLSFDPRPEHLSQELGKVVYETERSGGKTLRWFD